jgi:ubiquinone/menaquinone biosynthesis C-methylase UbiE
METFEEFYEMEGEKKRYSKDVYYYKSVQSLLPGTQIKTAFDAGCGDGHLCSLLKGIGMDVSKKRLLHAANIYPECKFLQGSIYDIPFKENSFEMVTAIEIIEHLKDPLAAVKELTRISKEYVLIQVPYNEIIQEETCPNCLKPIYPRGHIQSFDEKRLRSLCEECGLHVVRLDFFFHAFDHKLIRWLPGFLLINIKRWVFRDLMKHGGHIGILCKK